MNVVRGPTLSEREWAEHQHSSLPASWLLSMPHDQLP